MIRKHAIKLAEAGRMISDQMEDPVFTKARPDRSAEKAERERLISSLTIWPCPKRYRPERFITKWRYKKPEKNPPSTFLPIKKLKIKIDRSTYLINSEL